MKVDTIGVVGVGFVGTAVAEGMAHAMHVYVYDKFGSRYPAVGSSGYNATKPGSVDSIEDLCRRTKTLFVCVPTPMREDGSCDTTIVESVVEEINSYADGHTVVIKSTVVPGTSEMLDKKFKNISVCMNPEFLTEANFLEDFKNQDRIVIGGPRPASTKVARVYKAAFPKVPIIKTSSTIAELVKYTTNCFLATKISFANELFQVCEALDVDYDKVIEYATHDERLGTTFWAVPGPALVEGEPAYGFGLSCFPKDLNALIARAKELGVDPKVMSAVWDKNLEVRPPEHRDWEKMSKAVSKKKDS